MKEKERRDGDGWAEVGEMKSKGTERNGDDRYRWGVAPWTVDGKTDGEEEWVDNQYTTER